MSSIPEIPSSNNDKNEALAPLNILILVLKVLMDLVSRVLIFFIFMIVHNEGEFSPMTTLISFYIMVGIMIVFNIVFNERNNIGSLKYWLGRYLRFTFALKISKMILFLEVLINSFSSTLRLD